MFQFHKSYFVATILLFLIEVIIAMFINDNFIRPYLGDVLVVVLLYTFVKSFTNLSVLTAATAVGIFAVLIEIAQYYKLIHLLNLQHSAFAKAVLGNTFSYYDLICYAVGVLAILLIEKNPKHRTLLLKQFTKVLQDPFC